MRTWLIALLVCACALAGPASGQRMDLEYLRTRAEASNYEQTTGYDEAIGFLEVVAAQSPDLHLTTFGYSSEGRPLPLLVFGRRLGSAESVSVQRNGGLRVFIQANIHAGEVCGKEAMLALARDMAAGAYDEWADSLVILIAPIYNADGNERVDIYNRPRQNGPYGGMGQRPNAQGLDLNRDHMKLKSPEAKSLARMISSYDPHVLVDLHTTNGTQHGYHLTYAPPLHPNTHPEISGLLRDRWLPTVTTRIQERYGWDFYYYGNLPWRGSSGERGWYTFDHRPRFNNNYAGLRNRVAILSEAYAYASFRDRVLASRAFVEEILTYAHAHASEIRAIVERVDAESIVGTNQALRAVHERSDTPVDIIMGAADSKRNPYSGAPILVMNDERSIESMPSFGTFTSSESVAAPSAYIVPADLRSLRALLDDHGVRYDVLESSAQEPVSRFRIDSTRTAGREFQGVHERTLFGAFEPASVAVDPGSLFVPVDQPLGRLVVYLLEPRSDDGAVNWGVLDAALDGATHYPVLRVE